MTQKLMTLLAVGILAGTAAYGHGPGGPKGPRGPKAIPAPLTDEQKKYDKNGDGALSVEEVLAMHEAKKAEILAKYDTDKDGKLSDAEKAAMRDDQTKSLFDQFDTDKDGKLSLDELKALRNRKKR